MPSLVRTPSGSMPRMGSVITAEMVSGPSRWITASTSSMHSIAQSEKVLPYSQRRQFGAATWWCTGETSAKT